jgi:type VI secretion system protein ImpA
MPSAPILEFDALIAPISSENPSGIPVPFAVREKLEEYRKEVDPESFAKNDPMRPPAPQKADWPAIVSLAQETLRGTSKDLLVAARLTEALVKVHGFAGLRDGLQLMRLMVEQCWDRLVPAIETDDDLEIRAGAFNWLDEKDRGARFPITVRFAPLMTREKDQFGWQQWKDAQSGKAGVTPPDIERAIQATPRERCEQVCDDLNQGWTELDQLTRDLGSKLGQYAPGLSSVREAIGDCRALAQQILQKKGPAPARPDAKPAADGPSASATERVVEKKVETRAEAYAKIGELAGLLQQLEPHSPIPYLLNRAVELGAMPFPELMKALILNPDVLKLMNREMGIKDLPEKK